VALEDAAELASGTTVFAVSVSDVAEVAADVPSGTVFAPTTIAAVAADTAADALSGI